MTESGSRTVEPPDDDRIDLLAQLDEEIARLPTRYREPLRLCELEGVSRRAAADRLGLAEGTLSSRLARGRALLRDRLTRRGLAPGVALLGPLAAGQAEAALPSALADSTARLAVAFVSGGTVPAAVVSLAEGVLTMLASTQKMAILFGGLLALATTAALAIGGTRGHSPERGQPPSNPEPTPAVVQDDDPSKPREERIQGTVVDEAGQPVAGALVRYDPFRDDETRGTSGADGGFSIVVRRPWIPTRVLLAQSAEGDRIGLFQTIGERGRPSDGAAQVVLMPAREVVVRVVDGNRAPVADAPVQAAGDYAIVADGRTGPDGTARLRLPIDAKVQWVYALKGGLGIDFQGFGPLDNRGLSPIGMRTADLPRTVDLVLEKPRTIQIKAVGSDGQPLAGIRFYPWILSREDRAGQFNVGSPIAVVATGPDGIATFDWLPLPSSDGITFWPATQGYAHRRITVGGLEGTALPGLKRIADPAPGAGPVIAKLFRNATIRGRVTFDDGRPAPGIYVQADGTGRGPDDGHDQTRSAADGSYVLEVPPGEAYAVFVDDKDWAAPSRLEVVVGEGWTAANVDFRLSKGTTLRGRVTIGPDDRPVPKQSLMIEEKGGPPPAEFGEDGDFRHRLVSRRRWTTTDADGRYAFRVATGAYTLYGPPRTTNPPIAVTDQEEIVHDFHMPRPEFGSIRGRVVVAEREETGVAGAKLQIVAKNIRYPLVKVEADADGRFHAERPLDPLVIHARNADGSLAAIVEVETEQAEVYIPLSPTASASGRLLDEDGNPVANTRLSWGRLVALDSERTIWTNNFAAKVVTDADGRFTLPDLVVGQEYRVTVQRGNFFHQAGFVKPKAPGPIDLGTLQVKATRPATDPKR